MSPMLVVVELQNINGIPADSVTNSWAIAGPTPSNGSGEWAQVQQHVHAFYNAGAAPGPVGAYISPGVSRVALACKTRLYDLTNALGEGDDHGSPIANHAFTLPVAGGATPIPHECSAVLTLEGVGRSTAQVEIPDPTPEPRDEFDTRLALTDRPKARRTGRVFIGPLSTIAMQDDSDQSRPHPDLLTAMRNAAVALDTALKAMNPVEGEIGLGVWSRQGQTVHFIEAVSTDNAFDTQRRRGVKASLRTRVTV